RIVTAASLFDGHDAAINVMRRILQASGAEVIHLGHNRSAQEIVECAIQEDAQAVAVTSYQGGHLEFFKYMYDLFQERGAKIRMFGRGGGTILPSEIEALRAYGIGRIYSPDDGRAMGLQGMINDRLQRCEGIVPDRDRQGSNGSSDAPRGSSNGARSDGGSAPGTAGARGTASASGTTSAPGPASASGTGNASGAAGTSGTGSASGAAGTSGTESVPGSAGTSGGRGSGGLESSSGEARTATLALPKLLEKLEERDPQSIARLISVAENE